MCIRDRAREDNASVIADVRRKSMAWERAAVTEKQRNTSYWANYQEYEYDGDASIVKPRVGA